MMLTLVTVGVLLGVGAVYVLIAPSKDVVLAGESTVVGLSDASAETLATGRHQAPALPGREPDLARPCPCSRRPTSSPGAIRNGSPEVPWEGARHPGPGLCGRREAFVKHGGQGA